MLPKLNGFEVCRRLRADPRWRDLKVLMLTARGRDTEVARGLDAGADAYVTKPFSTRDLVAQIQDMLRSRA
jgi:two-component system, OmpR family, alkaline phosphatase synthesis response regulator PhoP